MTRQPGESSMSTGPSLTESRSRALGGRAKLNRAGFRGGILAWITRLGQAPPSERSSALRLRPGAVADGLEQPAVVEPVHPLKRGELDRRKGPPRPAPVDHLGLVEAVDRLGECVVKTVAHAVDRGLDPRPSQALGVANRDVLPGFKWSSQHLERGG